DLRPEALDELEARGLVLLRDDPRERGPPLLVERVAVVAEPSDVGVDPGRALRERVGPGRRGELDAVLLLSEAEVDRDDPRRHRGGAGGRAVPEEVPRRLAQRERRLLGLAVDAEGE